MTDAVTTRDIVTIAILSSLGGALSTFVGYLGNLVNLALGVPFGAGQFMAGLHVFWLVLIRILVPRSGMGTVAGLLKGMVEMFTGSTHGVVVVLVSLAQGIVIDLGARVAGDGRNPGSRLLWWITAGAASAVNVIVFQVLYFTGAPLWYVAYVGFLVLLAFCSGVIFAGYFAWETLEFLEDTRVLSRGTDISSEDKKPARILTYRHLPAVLFVAFLVVGSAYYITNVASPFSDPLSCRVTGLVETPFTFRMEDFSNQMVTIEAELIGSTTHLDPANYTGPLVSTILNHAGLLPSAAGLRVIARDGYTVEFDDLSAVMTDNRMLIANASDGLWLIAGDYDGSLWVRQISALEVY
jgi:ABC-type thiamin/hydroxymethylpyrimidine transport system permease subunit